MRTVPFKTILRECAKSQGVNPDAGSYTAEYAEELAEGISNRIALLWTQAFWPFLLKTERRQYRPTYSASESQTIGMERFYDDQYWYSLVAGETGNTPGADDSKWLEVLSVTSDDVTDYLWDPFVAWAQAGETVIPEDGFEQDEFLYFENPALNRWARPIRDVAEDDDGVHITASRYPVRPWIRFRPAPPRFTAEEYESDTNYGLSEVCYDPPTGECYRSLIADNTGNEVTDTASWEKQLFPQVFQPAVRLFAKAELLEKEEKFEASYRYMGRAQQLVDKLEDDFFASGNRMKRASVR